jgi:hypothetical protein
MKENTAKVDQKLASNFQQIMQRVWCDNTLMTGLEEVKENIKQIIESAEKSREVLGQLSQIPAHLEPLQKEWDSKNQALESFLESLTIVINQFQEECKQLRAI